MIFVTVKEKILTNFIRYKFWPNFKFNTEKGKTKTERKKNRKRGAGDKIKKKKERGKGEEERRERGEEREDDRGKEKTTETTITPPLALSRPVHRHCSPPLLRRPPPLRLAHTVSLTETSDLYQICSTHTHSLSHIHKPRSMSYLSSNSSFVLLFLLSNAHGRLASHWFRVSETHLQFRIWSLSLGVPSRGFITNLRLLSWLLHSCNQNDKRYLFFSPFFPPLQRTWRQSIFWILNFRERVHDRICCH